MLRAKQFSNASEISVCRILLLLALTCTLGADFLHAQVVTGTILGTVYDPNGSVVPNAQISATLVDRDVQRTIRTGPSGEYEMSFLPVGRYRLTVTANGFKIQVNENVELRLDQR